MVRVKEGQVYPDRWVQRYAAYALAPVIGLVIVATIRPFQFSPDPKLSGAGIGAYLSALVLGESNLDDIIHNVLLFLPLGYVLRAYFEWRGMSSVTRVSAITLLSAVLSFLIELTQLWMPTRYAALIDVAANTGGALFGALCFNIARLWCRSPRAFIAGGAFHYGLILIVIIALQSASSLQNWDVSYPLLIGKEGNDTRPWYGTMWQVRAADTAIPADEVHALLRGGVSPTFDAATVFDYELSGSGPFVDRSGHMPALRWYAQPEVVPATGVVLDGQRWLRSDGTAAAAIEAIRSSNAFTFDLTVASASPDQSGPARIVSISENTGWRNLTIAQSGDALVVRLRTLANGLNGVRQELRVPGIFATNNRQRVIIIYGQAKLYAYVSGYSRPYTLDFSPEAELLRLISPSMVRDVIEQLPNDISIQISQLLYASLLGVPPGIVIAWIAAPIDRRTRFPGAIWVLAGVGAILLPILSELLIATLGGRVIRPINLIAPSLISASSLLIFGRRALRYMRRQASKSPQ